MRNAKCVVASRLDCVAQLHRRHVGERRQILIHWQASHVGSSIAQNLTSVAGAALICACAVAAAASIALRPPDETAFSRPDYTVDFSAWVALMVRR